MVVHVVEEMAVGIAVVVKVALTARRRMHQATAEEVVANTVAVVVAEELDHLQRRVFVPF